MQKFPIFFVLCISTILVLANTGESKAKDNAALKFRVYVHEYTSGPNATLHEVGRATITAGSPTSFGLLRVGNSLMTSGPDASTGWLGRVEGLLTNTGLQEAAGVLHLEFVFTHGMYRGSNLSLLGWRRAAANGSGTEEVPVAGGTRKFRKARGYTLSSTYASDPTIGYIVYAYDCYVYLN